MLIWLKNRNDVVNFKNYDSNEKTGSFLPHFLFLIVSGYEDDFSTPTLPLLCIERSLFGRSNCEIRPSTPPAAKPAGADQQNEEGNAIEKTRAEIPRGKRAEKLASWPKRKLLGGVETKNSSRGQKMKEEIQLAAERRGCSATAGKFGSGGDREC